MELLNSNSIIITGIRNGFSHTVLLTAIRQHLIAALRNHVFAAMSALDITGKLIRLCRMTLST